MKNFTLSVLITLLTGAFSFAQNSNVIFFTENGEKFFVVLDGLKYNNVAETNVKITDITPTGHLAKIIFEDPALGEVEKKIALDPATETTVRIVKKKQSKLGKGLRGVTQSISNEANYQAGNTDDTNPEDKSAKEDWYVMRFQGSVPLATNGGSYQSTQPQASPTGNSTQGSTTESTTTTTTQSTANGKGNGSNFSLDVNINTNGGGMNTSETAYEETTTVTSTTTGGTVATADHYDMPGYNGAVGCPWPMEQNDWEQAKRSIEAKDFEDSKLTIAKQVIGNNCIVADQVRELMMLFDFESNKLDLAKFAYKYTYDLGNYFKVNDAFDFETSIDDLDKYISAQGR
jgi:hypothetical protein